MKNNKLMNENECPDLPTQEKVQEQAAIIASEYTSDELTTIASKNEEDLQQFLADFAFYASERIFINQGERTSQNPERPLPTRP